MFYIASTRFTTDTYIENMEYRKKHNLAVIYGSSKQICDKYLYGTLIFVIEMNISKDINRIEGIGIIRNRLACDKNYKIYKNNEYNNFIYSGDYWISREQILSMDKEIIDICDDILFKGKSHQKRYIGITMVTKKIFVHWNYDLIPLKNKIRLLFLKIYNNTKTISSITDITNITNITNNSLEKVEEIEQEAAEEEEIQVISKKRKISNL